MDKGEIYHTKNYGRLQIVQYLDSRNVRVRFIATGYETTATAYHIRKGEHIRDKCVPSVCGIGFSGDGEYTGAKYPRAYKCWEAMLFRCYGAETNEHLLVVEEWHNFQNFCDWYIKNQTENFRLNLKQGCTEYGPDTCTFLSIEESATVSNLTGITFTFQDTLGVAHSTNNRAEFCRQNGLDPSAVTRLVKGKQKTHKGWVFVGGK